MRILRNYIIKELLPPFIAGLAIFTFILIMDRIFDLANLIITKGVPLTTVVRLLLYTLPFSISLSVPMALLMATLIGFGRLSQDNEITAMKASGINTYAIMMIPISFALVVSIFMVFFNDSVVPMSNQSFKKLYYNIIYKNPVAKLEEHTFTDLQDHRIYIERINPKTSELENVVIYKNDDDTLITASRGISKSQKASITLELKDGAIHSIDRNNPSEYNRVAFETYNISMDFSSQQTYKRINQKSLREMNKKELRAEITRLKGKKISVNSLLVELYLRTVIPFACLAFAFIATPLGIKTQRGSKSIGFGMSLILIFIFYLLLLAGITIGEKGWVAPLIATWIPNIFMVAVGLFFMARAAKH
ncbi:MAG: LptF/LptG family permease [bacterium]